MKRAFMVLSLVGILSMGFIFGMAQVVSAQDVNPPASPTPGYARMGMVRQERGTGQNGLMHNYMEAAMAEKLGLSVEELDDLRAQGLTFWQIAEKKGFQYQEVQQMKIDARKVALNRLVEDGVLTQEQAETMQQRWSQMMEEGICRGNGAYRGYGMMGWRWSRGNQ